MKLKETTHTPVSRCPSCGHRLDAATGTADPVTPGSIAICLNCAALHEYNEALQVVRLTPELMVELRLSDQWEEIEQMIFAVKQVNRKRKTR